MIPEELRTYDPVYAHEYYMKHRKLKGRKKSSGTSTKTKYKLKNSSKKSSKKKSSKSKANKARESTASLNADGVKAAEVAKQKAENDKKEFMKSVKKAWDSKIKDLEKQAKSAKGEDLEKLKTAIATAQVEYKQQKKTVDSYYKESYLKELDNIKKDKKMRK